MNINELSLHTLMSSISMVFQNVYLFNDSIYNNIHFGNPKATKDQVIEAAKKRNVTTLSCHLKMSIVRC